MSEAPNYVLAERDYMSGMKYKDIADKYGVTLNTVKSWKQRYDWSKKGVHTKSEKVCTQKIENVESANKQREAMQDEVIQVIENEELNDKQRLFCLYYVRCFNATKAYQKAYECDYITANTNGSRLLVNASIKKEIQKLKQNKLNREFFSEEDVFQKYMDIAFADITDYVKFGQETVPVMGPFGPIQIKDDDTGEKVTLTKVVNAVRFIDSDLVDGTLISEVKQGKDGASIKLLDRQKALQWLAEHLDLATEEQKAKIELLKTQSMQKQGKDKDKELEKLDKVLSEIRGVI